MTQNREYKRFDPRDHQDRSEISEGRPKREIIPPMGIEDLLGEIDKAVSGSRLAENYRQTGGQ